MLFGAALGSAIPNPFLGGILAFLGHYFLDLFPHIEYSIDNIRSKKWQKAFPDILKVCLDFSLAIVMIFLFSKNQPIIYLGSLIAIIPDGLTIITSIFPKFLKRHNIVHTEKIHYLTKQKKFPLSVRILSQVLTGMLSIALLRYFNYFE
ncbi:MAG: hypothetical protein A3A98_03875 [Candidatus Staskawiczbacteria bacterium RIFCSPLOWO2_01_FULL_40_39]|uniref:Uncharacterized protein n=1 Tax=Candidatus Staskawiczbacteria bacterium RIFCSPHIGHO2_01_FULL_39_25 TaxID=1802202 RepID=A0A1G2HNT4_9BACT|nr:MAG: hypothetical protein A2730_03090 [Candidatus Staskawiczbacteria bacterium RIFCSPHIGHO2_01_FULL_39_25]OGZ73909.1 MAG: hypothetical protein A3A98_03875 [Candidatus Staskawiczbacteria bacterium RIFCSPLOWO2_01_FULL_40_39]OGZ76224.1 MAG: hypothetical protein A3I87_00095 [Candidatus Staskawiczbacteria bacterium RIFCSPLOWO2_02_FULL_39_8]